jgi:hypothetical protein
MISKTVEFTMANSIDKLLFEREFIVKEEFQRNGIFMSMLAHGILWGI